MSNLTNEVVTENWQSLTIPKKVTKWWAQHFSVENSNSNMTIITEIIDHIKSFIKTYEGQEEDTLQKLGKIT